MPSTSSPFTAVNPSDGPRVHGGGGGAANAALVAHITDPTDAHLASAIGYAGGPAWADGTTNPAATVEAEIDKILTDLGSGDGAGKIRYNGGAAWADGTTNPAATLGVQLDKYITDLNATTGSSGSHKIGSASITHPTLTVPAGTLFSQLQYISAASGVDYSTVGQWNDGTGLADGSVQGAIDEILTDLASTTALVSGTRKIGCEQITNTSFTIPAQSLVLTVRDISRAPNIQFNAGPTWLGGRTNPATTLQLQLEKIINDLGATSTNDDGAERIGTQAAGGLSGGSVRAQLNELDVNWGKLSRANTWASTQTLSGDPAIITSAPRVLWRFPSRTVFQQIYTRLNNDSTGFGITDNATYNGAAYQADDTTEPAQLVRISDSGLEIFIRGNTSSPWTTWDRSGRYGDQSIFLGNTTTSGPAPIVCTFDGENGLLRFSNTASSTSSDSNPPATAGHINVLKAKNIPKMWANVVPSSNQIQDGFNIASIASSGNTCTVNIQSDLADNDFAVLITCMTDAQVFAYCSSRTTGTMVFKAWNANTGTQVVLDTTPHVFGIVIFGVQDS